MSVASIRKEVVIEAPAEVVWDAVRDVGQAHTRLAPGVLTDARLEEGARVVTFANGMVVRERIVDVDDGRRRLAYSATGGRATHHHASIQVAPEGERRCRLTWITDVLPHEMAGPIGALMEQGSRAMKLTLEVAEGG